MCVFISPFLFRKSTVSRRRQIDLLSIPWLVWLIMAIFAILMICYFDDWCCRHRFTFSNCFWLVFSPHFFLFSNLCNNNIVISVSYFTVGPENKLFYFIIKPTFQPFLVYWPFITTIFIVVYFSSNWKFLIFRIGRFDMVYPGFNTGVKKQTISPKTKTNTNTKLMIK